MEETIFSIIRSSYPDVPSNISRDTRFRDDLDFDSLDMIDLRTRIEVILSVKIDFERLRCIKSVGELIDCVALAKSKRNAQIKKIK